MSTTEDKHSILLFQLREEASERDLERRAIERASGIVGARLVSVDVLAGDASSARLEDVVGVIVCGSKSSVFEDVPGLDRLKEVLADVRERKIPMLGICFGAQLIAECFGGEVKRDKEREELGTVDVTTTDEAWTDLLFADTPETFAVQAAHQDRITRLPDGAILLATNETCVNQAFAIPAANIYGVQFHPERSKADFEWLIDHRIPEYYDGVDSGSVRDALRESPEAERLVRKFVERMAVRREPVTLSRNA